MKNNQLKFTIFTPCYNSEKFIHRVYDSLEKQAFKNFEWLLIDDCSTDNTYNILKEYEEKASFKVRVYRNETNQGLTKNINKGVSSANGELFIIQGHDDEFTEDALIYLDDVWNRLGSEKHTGIWSKCKNQHGKLIGKVFPKEELDSNLFTVFFEHIWKNELFPCTRTKVMRQFPLEETLNYVPEGLMWARIATKYDTIFVNKVTRIYYQEVDNPNALTKRSRKKIAKSVIYQNTVWLNELVSHLEKGYLFKVRLILGLALHGILENRSFNELQKSLKYTKHKFLLAIAYSAVSIYNKVKPS